jgi:hypothetical protein
MVKLRKMVIQDLNLLAWPAFRSLDYGANSGQIVVSVKAQAGAQSRTSSVMR